jgi:hypothetical protein
VLPGHYVPPVGLGDRAVTREHGECRDGIITKKEQYFLPPVCRIGHGEVDVGINSMSRFDIEVHTIRNHRLRT